MTLGPGDRLGPYEIVALLGIGGMGEVYRGKDTRLGRDVALKVISPRLVGDPALRRRFEREARAASALNHPAIVTVYDVGESDGTSWIAMEWVSGHTLRQRLAETTLSIPEVSVMARQVAEGLAAAHAKGVVHRDLKPENVMVDEEGRVRILDFGLARQGPMEAFDESMTVAGTTPGPPIAATVEGAILGTVGYMSPEQAAGQPVDYRSDQFAFGLLLYEMLAGRRAFDRPTTVETLWAVIKDEPAPVESLREGIPEPLVTVIARCLAKRPDDRYASTRDLVAALEVSSSAGRAGTSATTGGVLPARPAPAWTTRPRGRRVTIVAAVLGLALALGAGSVWWAVLGPTHAAIDSLAVLPFENRSTGSDAEYLGDEIAESLIDQMSRVQSLRVMARGTAFRFREATDPQDAGRQMNVGAVLVGTVARRGTQVVITAELIDVATGARLWGQRYDRAFAELLHVQDALASEIAGALRLRLSPEAARALGGQGTDNPDAYELFLKARHLLLADSEETDLEARRLYQQAVEKDPRFVDAHLGIVSTYARSAGNGYAPPKEAWANAEAALKRALALDPGNVRARASRAAILLQRDWNWAAAEREFTALADDPRLFTGNQYHAVAIYYWAKGRPDQSVELLERALRVDPGNLESRIMMAGFLVQAGRLEAAIEYYRALVEVAPADPRPLFGLAEALRRRADLPATIAAQRKAYDLSGDERGARALAGARTEEDYAKAEREMAKADLEDLLVTAKERYVSPLDLGRAHARVGNREEAFASLEAALNERAPMLILLKVDRAWDSIRADARFAAVVRRIGIP